MTRLAIVGIAGLGLTSSGCFQQHRKLVLPPPAPVVAKPLPKPQIEAPPAVEAQMQPYPSEQVTLPASPQMENPPARPAPRRRPPATPAAGAGTPTPAPAETETPAPASPTPVPTTPQLSEILTEDRRRQYEAEFAGYISRAKAVVSRASRRPLSQRQKETMQRIETFLQQAEESKTKDVVTALQLARRADLLGQDLLRTLR
jgi:hypothetical protein